MTDTPDRKRDAADQFDEHAEAYVDSEVHRIGDDLEQLAEWCRGADRALDVATGAGHTAGAVREAGVDRVVATDAAPSMVTTARETIGGIDGVVADAETLPFGTSTFDAVTCRIAAHHFPDPAAFVSEVARILEDGGTFAFEDNVAPDDGDLDAFLNRIERLRDPTHVRSHTVGEWHDWLDEAGFSIETSRVVKKTIEYDDWVAQLDTPEEAREELEELFSDPPEGAGELFELTYDDGTIATFDNLKVLVRATR